MNIEEKLSGLDFSKHSKVENSLLIKLLSQRRGRSLSMNDLDMVVAAGTKYPPQKEEITKA